MRFKKFQEEPIMLKNINDIYGTQLAATDGNIGQVDDFYFDDKSWSIRYLIVDTGSWLSGRQVLLAPEAFDGFDAEGDVLAVRLTKDQIENSPSIESQRPVTRQHERDYYHYYSWPAYWDNSGIWAVEGIPVLPPVPEPDGLPEGGNDPLDDIHLQSTKSLIGYEIEAVDGTLGSVTGFLVDPENWEIAELVVETGHWYSGKQILISPSEVRSVDFEKSKVVVKLTREEIQQTPEDQVAVVGSSPTR